MQYGGGSVWVWLRGDIHLYMYVGSGERRSEGTYRVEKDPGAHVPREAQSALCNQRPELTRETGALRVTVTATATASPAAAAAAAAAVVVGHLALGLAHGPEGIGASPALHVARNSSSDGGDGKGRGPGGAALAGPGGWVAAAAIAPGAHGHSVWRGSEGVARIGHLR